MPEFGDDNYVLEFKVGESWVEAVSPRTAASLDEARELYGKASRLSPYRYRIRDRCSQKVYSLFEATGDIPKSHADAAISSQPTPDDSRGIDVATAAPIPTEVTGGTYTTKTSGVRESIGQMVRSPATGKTNFTLILRGVMFQRWAELLTRGAVVYGADNWLEGLREADPAKRKAIKQRYLESGARHYVQWIRGDQDEDHAAAVFFNINGYESMVWTDNIVTREERLEEIERLVS